MAELHIYAPPALSVNYRVLPKYCCKFLPEQHDSWRRAFEVGLKTCADGFRVFRQSTYEWHEPLDQELIKVSGLLRKELNK